MSGIREQDSNYVAGLDSLRFVLAAVVMLSHLSDPYVVLMKESAYPLIRYGGMFLHHLFCGNAAVISFFVISGFVIHRPNVGKLRLETGYFLVRRWVRLGLPLLVVSLFAGYFHLFLSMPFWSLFCELVYYTLYPLLFRLPGTWRSKLAVSFVFATVVIVLFNQHNLYSMVHQVSHHYKGTYGCNGPFITWAIGLPCWLLGGQLAAKTTKSRSVSFSEVLVWRIGALALSMGLLALEAHLFVSLVLTLNFYAVYCYFWIGTEIDYYRERRPVRLLEQAGKWSYSLFICHKLVFYILVLYLPLTTTSFPFFLLSASLISWVFYVVVERPSHQLARKWSRHLMSPS